MKQKIIDKLYKKLQNSQFEYSDLADFIDTHFIERGEQKFAVNKNELLKFTQQGKLVNFTGLPNEITLKGTPVEEEGRTVCPYCHSYGKPHTSKCPYNDHPQDK